MPKVEARLKAHRGRWRDDGGGGETPEGVSRAGACAARSGARIGVGAIGGSRDAVGRTYLADLRRARRRRAMTIGRARDDDWTR